MSIEIIARNAFFFGISMVQHLLLRCIKLAIVKAQKMTAKRNEQ